jgi:dihydroorotase
VLERLEAFASENGPRFYGLPLNEGQVTLERSDAIVPERIGDVVPFGAGESFGWRLAEA